MHAIAPFARTAYVQGWAESGGPLTDRVAAGCVAAVQLAIEHADDPGIIEATLQLGKLEGLWAAIFDRRLDRHAVNHADVATVWTAAAKRLSVGGVVAAARRRAGVGEAAGNPVFDDARRAARDLLASLPADSDIRTVLRDALAAAMAEGSVDAQALNAIDAAGFDFHLAFQDAYDALADEESIWGEVDSWLATMVDGVSADLGRLLSRMTAEGASREEMLAAAQDLLANLDGRAVTTIVDWATSKAMSAGALRLYGSEGVEWVDFVSAGDQAVCTDGPNCAAAEENSPYRLIDAPQPGLHPGCRCVLAPASEPFAATPAAAPPPEVVADDTAATATAGTGGVKPIFQPASPVDSYEARQKVIRDLANIEPAATRQLGGGQSAYVRLVTFPDGTQAVEKIYGERYQQTTGGLKREIDAELLGARVVDALGLRVPAITQAAERGRLLMEYLDGEVGGGPFAGWTASQAIADSADGRLLGLADFLMANVDRNSGNWLLLEDGSLAGIDHGSAFILTTKLDVPTSQFTEYLMAGVSSMGRSVLAKVIDIAPSDVLAIRKRLKALRTDFAEANRLSWYNQMMNRLDAIAQRATGTVSRLAT